MARISPATFAVARAWFAGKLHVKPSSKRSRDRTALKAEPITLSDPAPISLTRARPYIARTRAYDL